MPREYLQEVATFHNRGTQEGNGKSGREVSDGTLPREVPTIRNNQSSV